MDYDWIHEMQKVMDTCIATIDVRQYVNGPFPDRPGKYWIYATGSFPAYFDGKQ